MGHSILLVEDAPDLGPPLVRTLEREGYSVTWVQNGAAGLDHVARSQVDLVILDLGLPDMDGLDVCQHARAGGYDGGIIICTARGDELDKVVGLDYGADDYLPKPFGLPELHARVRALLRRTRAGGPAVSPPDPRQGLVVDRTGRRVHHDGTEIPLTVKEYGVLELLTRQPGAVVSREQLMAEVWDENWFGSTKTLDVTIARLRHKLEEARAPERIVNVRGVGFRVDADAPDA